jgi:hypothetical protein
MQGVLVDHGPNDTDRLVTTGIFPFLIREPVGKVQLLKGSFCVIQEGVRASSFLHEVELS